MDKKEVYLDSKNNWGGLFNKKRFEWMMEERDKYLKDLSIEKSVVMLEVLTSKETLNEFKKGEGTNSLPEIFRKTISFLEREGFDYLVIGGIASSVLGRPRMTEDIDICIHIKKEEILEFLKRIEKDGFVFDREKILRKVKETGTFQIFMGDFHVDFIILSTDFEKSAFLRKQRIVVYGIEASFPTPEDLILFKIVPGRHIDMADIENIAKRYANKLDKEYLIEWAQRLSDEAQDMRIYNQIEKLLRCLNTY